jgi:non-specific serine/threonine protein kinase
MASLETVKSRLSVGPTDSLPPQLTSFVGRRGELAELRELLRHNRLVTLTGSAGSGKTRLALQLAIETRAEHPDGSWFVPLAPVADPSRIVAATAQALGVNEEIDRSLADTVADYLRSRHGLLVLDNCEHLVRACADLVLSLLTGCPNLRVVATSREPLRLPGERAWPVPPLSLPPEPGEDEGTDSGPSEAMLLFADRGGLVRRSFQVTNANSAAVGRICRRLDGMPLAIELGAARLRVLTVDEIESRLERRFRLLQSGEHGVIPRHQTLRAAVDWSFHLLSEPEQALFGRLAIFAGGFTLRTTEAICPGGDIGAEDLLDLVTSLVEKSLVVAEEADGEARFRLLETMREFGRERLVDNGELPGLLRRHAAYFLEAAVATEAKLTGAGQAGALRWLHDEQDDLSAALDWWRRHDPDEALRMAAALGMFWYMQGLLTEGRQQLVASLQVAPADSPYRAAGLYAVGLLEHRHADYDDARAHFDSAEALFQAMGDARGVGRCRMRRAKVIFEQGDMMEGLHLLEDALTILRAVGDEWAVAQTLHDFGVMHGIDGLGQSDPSIQYHEEALHMRRVLGDLHAAAFTLFSFAQERLPFQSRHDMVLEALDIFRRFDDPVGVTVCLHVCAVLAADSGQPRRAVTLLAAAEAARARIGGVVPERLRLGAERWVSTAAGQLAPAEVATCAATGRAMSLRETVAMVTGPWTADPEVAPERSGPHLTRRESEVARLVAAGLSNRQIADRLFISPRTAEYHVEQIRNKLGFHSRAQVAAWSAEKTGSPTP